MIEDYYFLVLFLFSSLFLADAIDLSTAMFLIAKVEDIITLASLPKESYLFWEKMII